MAEERDDTLAAIERAKAYRARITDGPGLLLDAPSQFSAADFDLVLAAADRGANVVSIQYMDLRQMQPRPESEKP